MKKGERVLWLGLIHIVRTPGKATPYSTTHCSRSFNHKEVARMKKSSPTCLFCVHDWVTRRWEPMRFTTKGTP